MYSIGFFESRRSRPTSAQAITLKPFAYASVSIAGVSAWRAASTCL
jgi:hypothetical protein